MTEEELKAISDQVYKIFSDVESKTVQIIAERLGRFGEVSATDIYRLNELSRYGADITEIERLITEAANLSADEVNATIYKAAKAQYEESKGLYAAAGKDYIAFADSYAAQTFVNSTIQAIVSNIQSIYGLSGSISGTVGFVRDGAFSPLREYYQKIIDDAALAVRTGQTDYYSAMRGAVKEMSDYGVCVEYDSGYIRRADSSVRVALNGGLSRINAEMTTVNMQALGTNLVEVSSHYGARPSHAEWQGKVYEWSKYSSDSRHKKNYPDFEKVTGYGTGEGLGGYNCYHTFFPFVEGASEQALSASERQAIRNHDNTTFVFEGKSYTPYEASQMQRKIETAIRREKDRAVAFGAMGDKDAQTIAKAKVTALNSKYNAFSNATNLTAYPNRKSVSGYTRGKSA